MPGRRLRLARVASLLGLLGLCSTVGAGCLITIEPAIACGDGYVDLAAGEQCDPADPLRGFEGACSAAGMSAGKAACDPETCQLVVSVEQCAVCGDNIAEGLESCDGSDLRVPPCADAICRSDCTFDASVCPTCGNGVFDPDRNEECDASELCRLPGEPEQPGLRDCVDPDDPPVTMGKFCVDLPVLAIGIQNTEYARGKVNLEDCEDTCQFSRENCDFCGNGTLEPQHDDLGAGGNYFTRAPEVCEVGPAGDNADAHAFCAEFCTPGEPNSRVLCDFECRGACTQFELNFIGDPTVADPETELGCCLAKGEPCGVPGQLFPCCGAENDPQGACQLDVGGGTPTFRCAPNGPPASAVP